jgi:hypothetical protein
MKIRSLLLGSVAAAGLSTAGFAADLGVITALDVCDELGISGLTISSDDNCLAISGGVEAELWVGNYGGGLDWGSSWDVWLDFTATAPTDFGPATAYLKVEAGDSGPSIDDLDVVEAWVSVGDTTVFTAGFKGSLYDSHLDAPDGGYDWDFGVTGVDIGDVVGFQVTSAVADGFSVGAAIEENTFGGLWGVGVASYQGNGIAAEGHVAVDLDGIGPYEWLAYGAFQGYFDPVSVAASISADSTGDWDAFFGAAVTIDMFTLVGSVNTNELSEWVFSGEIEAGVTDEVSIYISGEYDYNADWEVELGIEASVTETLTADAHVGTDIGGGFHAGAGLTWAPGGDTEFGVDGEIWDNGDYQVVFSASKEFQ